MVVTLIRFQRPMLLRVKSYWSKLITSPSLAWLMTVDCQLTLWPLAPLPFFLLCCCHLKHPPSNSPTLFSLAFQDQIKAISSLRPGHINSCHTKYKRQSWKDLVAVFFHLPTVKMFYSDTLFHTEKISSWFRELEIKKSTFNDSSTTHPII